MSDTQQGLRPAEQTNPICYYAVYHIKYDGALLYQDLLCELREAFFSTGRRLKNKVVREVGGVPYRYSYVLEQGYPLKWKKMEGVKLLEKSSPNEDGSYQVVTQNGDKRVTKIACYSPNHLWLRTEYYDAGYLRTPALVLAPLPDGRGMQLFRYENGSPAAPVFLAPCVLPAEEEARNAVNVAVGTPEIMAKTSHGLLCFCTPQEAARRAAAMQEYYDGKGSSLLAPQPESGQLSDEQEGFRVDPAAFEKAAEMDPAPLEEEPDIQQEETLDPNSYQWGYTAETPGLEEEADAGQEGESVSSLDDGGEERQEGSLPEEEEPSASGQLEEPDQVDAASEEEAPAGTAVSPMESEDEKKEQPNQAAQEPAPAYTYDTIAAQDADLESRRLSPEERQTVRRYNVFVQPISKNPYAAYTPPEEADAAAQQEGQAPEQDVQWEDPVARLPEQENVCDPECPFSGQEKLRIHTENGEHYYYFGHAESGLRQGRGRTVMPDGTTAYEGEYQNGKRDGFGVYYFKTGKLCYVGGWKENKRQGTGISFRPSDGAIHVGRWEEDAPAGMGSRFDSQGNLLFAGSWSDGQRQGPGVSYQSQSGRIFVGQWKNDSLCEKGTEFDSQGNLLYSGGWQDGARNGFGTQYDASGDIVYRGEWRSGRYDGEGTLHLDNGNTVRGHFTAGAVCGQAVEWGYTGCKVYDGQWKDGVYHGQGCRYFPNGGCYRGRFEQGEPIGRLKGYDAQGRLVYEGEWKDDEFSGQGCYYDDGEKVYEGSFSHNCFDGRGFAYLHGDYVYSGEFSHNLRSGLGTSYLAGKPEYTGQWRGDQYEGCGVLYEEGKPRYAGCFSAGLRQGRINWIHDGAVSAECLYDNDELVYLRQYADGSQPGYAVGALVLEGSMQNGKLNGMGCRFSPYGEKLEEGIFRDGKLVKAMQVSLRTLSPLPPCPELENTEYHRWREAPPYAVEDKFGNGVYSGQLKDGRPHGKGTMLYADHRFTGDFVQGEPYGPGVVYYLDGTTAQGEFFPLRGDLRPEMQRLTFADGVVYSYQKKRDREQ